MCCVMVNGDVDDSNMDVSFDIIILIKMAKK